MLTITRTLSLAALLIATGAASHASSISITDALPGQLSQAALVRISEPLVPAGSGEAPGLSQPTAIEEREFVGAAAGETEYTAPLEVPLPGSGLLFVAALIGLIGRRIRPADFWRTPPPS